MDTMDTFPDETFSLAFELWVREMSRRDLYTAIWNRRPDDSEESEDENGEPPATFFEWVEALSVPELRSVLWRRMSEDEREELEGDEQADDEEAD